jgi:hypothetical protein
MNKRWWRSRYVWAIPATAVAIVIAFWVLSRPPNYRENLKMNYAYKVYVPTMNAVRVELNKAAAASTMPTSVQSIRWPAGADRAMGSRMTFVTPAKLPNGQSAPLLILQPANDDGPLEADDRVLMWADGRYTVDDDKTVHSIYSSIATAPTTGHS